MQSGAGRAILAAAVMGIVSGAWAQSAPRKPAETAPSEPSPLHNEIVDKYMAGDWTSLETEITQKQKDISALPKDQLADVRYIVQALNECHPLWWKQSKTGGQGNIRASVWQRNVAVQFQNGGNLHLDYLNKAGSVNITLTWPSADMESDTPAEHGFTKGDLTNVGIWGLIEQASVWGMMPGERLVQMKGAERTAFDRYTGLRQEITAGYYGTPRARQWAVFLGLDAYFGDHVTAEGFIARKPVGAMFIAEVAGHPAQYPDIQLPGSVDPSNAENRLATGLMREIGSVHWSFEEDKALREAVRQFGMANGTNVFNTGRIAFSNKQVMALDPAVDSQAAPRRNKWLADAIANGGDPDAKSATKPANKPTTSPAEKSTDSGMPWRP